VSFLSSLLYPELYPEFQREILAIVHAKGKYGIERWREQQQKDQEISFQQGTYENLKDTAGQERVKLREKGKAGETCRQAGFPLLHKGLNLRK
jgi:hypothetical protein